MWPTVTDRQFTPRSRTARLASPTLELTVTRRELFDMDASVSEAVNNSTTTASYVDDVSWHTTPESLTEEEEGAIVTLVVVVIGVIVAIVILFSMGIFIDCRHQNKGSTKKKGLRLKMPQLSRRRNLANDGKSLASDMCPNGDSDVGSQADTRNAIV